MYAKEIVDLVVVDVLVHVLADVMTNAVHVLTLVMVGVAEIVAEIVLILATPRVAHVLGASEIAQIRVTRIAQRHVLVIVAMYAPTLAKPIVTQVVSVNVNSDVKQHVLDVAPIAVEHVAMDAVYVLDRVHQHATELAPYYVSLSA